MLGGDLGDRDRRLGDPARLLGGEDHAGGETPGAAVDHPDGEAEVLGVAGRLEHAVAGAEVLVAHPLEAEVGVGRAELGGSGQRDVTEAPVGQRGEGRIEPDGANLTQPLGWRA